MAPGAAPMTDELRDMLIKSRNLLSHPKHWDDESVASRERLMLRIDAYLKAGAWSVASSAEPVAWRVRYKRSPDYWIIFQHYPTDAMQDPEREVFPLYSGAEPIGKSAS